MKPKTEIYSIRIKDMDAEGHQRPVVYMVGNQIQSYKGLPTTVESITLAKGLLTISYGDGTARVLGYEPMIIDLFTRIVEEKPKKDDGTTA